MNSFTNGDTASNAHLDKSMIELEENVSKMRLSYCPASSQNNVVIVKWDLLKMDLSASSAQTIPVLKIKTPDVEEINANSSKSKTRMELAKTAPKDRDPISWGEIVLPLLTKPVALTARFTLKSWICASNAQTTADHKLTTALPINVPLTKPFKKMEHAKTLSQFVDLWKSCHKMVKNANSASHTPDLKMMVKDVVKMTAQEVSFNMMELAWTMETTSPTSKCSKLRTTQKETRFSKLMIANSNKVQSQ